MATSTTKPVATSAHDDIEVIAVNIDDPNLDPIALGFASREAFDAYVQEGIDSIEREGTIPHHVVMAEMRALIDSYRT